MLSLILIVPVLYIQSELRLYDIKILGRWILHRPV